MDKEELVEVTVSPSEDLKPASTTTTETTTTAPEVSTDQHAEDTTKVEVIGEPKTEETQVPEVKDNDDERIRKEREFNKMSKLEKERNEYAKVAEETRKARYKDYLEDLNDPATTNKARNRLVSNPQAYEEFRNTHKELTGEDLGTYASRFGSTQSGNQQNGEFKITDTEELKKIIRQEVQSEQTESQRVAQQRQDAEAFWKVVPQMAPSNAKTQEEYDQMVTKAGSIERIASGFMQLNSNLSVSEAYVKAWNILDENRDKQVQFARESGELAGMAKAFNNASSASAVSSGSGGSAIQNQSYKLTRSERDHYEMLKNNDPKLAEKYAKKAHELHLES